MKQPPWLRRADWRAGVVRSDVNRRQIWLPVIFFFLGFLPFGFIRYPDERLLFALFAVCVTAFLSWYVYGQYRSLSIGISEFRFDHVPFIAGSAVRGTIFLPFEIRTGSSKLELYLAESGGDPDVVAERDFKADQLEHRDGEARVPVDFYLGSDAPPSSEAVLVLFGRTTWSLRLTHSAPGMSYTAWFEIPIGPADAEVRETLHVRASKHRLQESLSVFDEPDLPAQ
jgi:hypothetical protein